MVVMKILTNCVTVERFEGLELDHDFKSPFEMNFIFVSQKFCVPWVHKWNT
jgi:hypothetical protein